MCCHTSDHFSLTSGFNPSVKITFNESSQTCTSSPGEENITSLEEELESERITSQKLRDDMQSLREEHNRNIDSLKLEVGSQKGNTEKLKGIPTVSAFKYYIIRAVCIAICF